MSGKEPGAVAEEQTALQRVATLVARGVPLEEVFATVAEEVGRALSAGYAHLGRCELDGAVTVIASWGAPARADRSAETPIIVEGRRWGVVIVGLRSGEQPPADAEARLASFTELAATAIAKAERRAALAQMAEEQAALRRVATLVARGVPPEEVFATVAEEVGRLLPVDSVSIVSYQPVGMLTYFGVWGTGTEHFPLGSRWLLAGHKLATLVFETGRPARNDRYADLAGPIVAPMREMGLRSGVATPIIVEGRLWGVIRAGSSQGPLPPDTEARLASFTELVAMAIENAESRAALAASRARIVVAADEARRRIERDLHDGTQQELVSLMLDLRMVQASVPAELGELSGELSRIIGRLSGVMSQVQEISRGIHPAILSRSGLQPALTALARRSAVPVELDLRARRRLPEQIEVAAYYAVSEAMTNAAKHANASRVHVELGTADAIVRLAIRDDGIGGADPARGSGLTGLSDRIEALGGTLEVTSPADGGTTLLIEIPVDGQSTSGARTEVS